MLIMKAFINYMYMYIINKLTILLMKIIWNWHNSNQNSRQLEKIIKLTTIEFMIFTSIFIMLKQFGFKSMLVVSMKKKFMISISKQQMSLKICILID